MTEAERDKEQVLAQDGLLARRVGAWAEEKLYYVDRYMDIFSTGMKNRWPRRVYIDLFSGPGRCIVDESNREFDGSALLSLNPKYSFTQLYFNDLDPKVTDALQRRVGDDSRVVIVNKDCNQAARDAVSDLSLDAGGTLALAFVDPTGFQISFESLVHLTAGRRPIDLIITFMTGYLKRFIEQPSLARRLDGFFGSSDWRDLVDLKAAGERLTTRKLLDHYEAKLRKVGYQHVDDHVRILNRQESPMYHLIFASKSEKGLEFFRKISALKFDGQRRLL